MHFVDRFKLRVKESIGLITIICRKYLKQVILQLLEIEFFFYESLCDEEGK